MAREFRRQKRRKQGMITVPHPLQKAPWRRFRLLQTPYERYVRRLQINFGYKTTIPNKRIIHYVYEPLYQPNEIRFFVLEPGSGKEPLCGHLIYRNLASDPKYEAISYVWGNPEKNHPILCDGQLLMITANLYKSLLQIRYPNQSCVLWADSICINQNDDAEKGVQMSLMGEIYRRADRVLITLGSNLSSERYARNAGSLVREVNHMIETTLAGLGDGYNTFPSTKPDDVLLTDPRWEALGQLTSDPWFRRGWVVQEAGLAGDAQLLWGNVTVAWMDILRVHTWKNFRASQIKAKFGFRVPKLHMDQYERRCWNECKTFLPRAASLYTPIEILSANRYFRFSDIRDRVYALLALPGIGNALKGLEIKCQKDFMEVYRDTALRYINNTHDLSILHSVQNDNITLEAEFPSWVPQWQRTLYQEPIKHRWAECIVSSSRQTRSSTLTRAIVVDNRILKVRGIFLDTISATTSTFSEKNRSTSLKDVQSAWAFVSEQINAQNLVYQHWPLLFVFCEAIRLGRLTSSFSGYTWHSAQKAHRAHMAIIAGPTFQTTLEAKLAVEIGSSELKSAHRIVQKNLANRRVAVTCRGYLAIVPGAARPGDVCGLIFGAKTPFILRRTADAHPCYKIVGDAFIVSAHTREEGNEHPFRLGTGPGAKEDWVGWGLKEQLIILC